MPRKRYGLALIVVVGVLGVLAVLGTGFVMMAQLERRSALQRVHATKAFLLARSGLEDALARLAAGQDTAGKMWRGTAYVHAKDVYLGENWDGDVNQTLNATERAQEVFNRGGYADIDSCPVRHAMRPSFSANAGPPFWRPRLVSVDRRTRGYTGVLSDDLAPTGNHYALKLLPQGGLYVNGGDPTAATDLGYNAVLRRILGTLAEACDRELYGGRFGVWTGADDGSPVDQADGERLVDLRPQAGWRSFEQIRDVALGGSQAKLDALRPFLALRAWVDRKVIVPNAAAAMVGRLYSSGQEIRLDHEDTQAFVSKAPAFERIPPVVGKVVGRAPVSFEWARSRPVVLVALLAGLKGIWLDESVTSGIGCAACPPGTVDIVGQMCTTELLLDWSRPMDEVRGVAQQMQFTSVFGEIRTWSDFAAACDRIPAKTWQGWRYVQDPEPLDANYGLGGMRFAEVQAKRDILKANFNPNTDLVKFNPNPTFARMLDKSDLLRYSTEFSLLPVSAGADHEAESVGRVLDARGRVVAVRTLKATISAPCERICLTTQRELVSDALGEAALAGDESALRMPGYMAAGVPAFISQSQGSGRTWGHRLDTRPLYPDTWLDADDGNGNGACLGLSLQTYPEPCGTSGLSMAPADYDGNLQLATVETANDGWYGAPASTRDLKLLARWDDGFELDVADGSAACTLDTRQTTSTALGLWSAFKPGTLYPDGCYSEWGACPAYPSAGNAHGFHGLMSFWVKPSYDQRLSNNCLRTHRYVRWSNHNSGTVGTVSTDQLFYVGNVWGINTIHDPNCPGCGAYG